MQNLMSFASARVHRATARLVCSVYELARFGHPENRSRQSLLQTISPRPCRRVMQPAMVGDRQYTPLPACPQHLQQNLHMGVLGHE
jgi:hypothetical protein